MVTEVFDKEKGCLVSTWEGDVILSEVADYIRRTKTNKEYPRKLKILTHAENASLKLGLNDLYLISKENKESIANYEAIIDAFIVDAALGTALSTMYQQVSTTKDYYFKVFSSLEAALEWLDSF
jgi:hypothetical protein